MADQDLPVEYGLERDRLARRQRLADMLMQQSMAPIQQQPTQPGGFAVPVSPLSGVAKVMQAYLGGKAGHDIDAQSAALGGRYRQGMADELQRYQQTKDGTPGFATQMDPQETEQMADQGSPMPPNVGAVAGDPRAAVRAAMLSQYAPVRELGKLDFTAQQQDRTRADERAFRASESAEARTARLAERAMVLEAHSQDLARSEQDRAAARAEAADLRREVLKSQQEFAAQQRREGAADRAAMTGAGKTPPGYRTNPDGTMTAIPGGPADTKLTGAFNADTNALQGGIADLDRLALEANKVLTHPGLPRITGLMGKVPNIPGSDAANAEALLGTLKSQVGFGVLQAMRNASKTGGALGAVSDAEGKRLEANLASLDKSQSLEQFQNNLNQIIKFTEDAKGRMRSAYNMKHQTGAAPGGWAVVK